MKTFKELLETHLDVGDTVWVKHPTDKSRTLTGKITKVGRTGYTVKHKDNTEASYPHKDVNSDYPHKNPYAKNESVEELDEAMTPQQKMDFDRMMAGAMKRDDYNKKWKKPLKSDAKVIYGKNFKSMKESEELEESEKPDHSLALTVAKHLGTKVKSFSHSTYKTGEKIPGMRSYTFEKEVSHKEVHSALAKAGLKPPKNDTVFKNHEEQTTKTDSAISKTHMAHTTQEHGAGVRLHVQDRNVTESIDLEEAAISANKGRGFHGEHPEDVADKKFSAMHESEELEEGKHESTIAAMAKSRYTPEPGHKIITKKGGQVPGTVEKLEKDYVYFRHPEGKLFRTHKDNVQLDRSVKESEELEEDKNSFLGKIKRHHELKKKVDQTWKDLVDAQKSGDKEAGSKAFRKHERYANLERPGTWTKVKESEINEEENDKIFKNPNAKLKGGEFKYGSTAEHKKAIKYHKDEAKRHAESAEMRPGRKQSGIIFHNMRAKLHQDHLNSLKESEEIEEADDNNKYHNKHEHKYGHEFKEFMQKLGKKHGAENVEIRGDGEGNVADARHKKTGKHLGYIDGAHYEIKESEDLEEVKAAEDMAGTSATCSKQKSSDLGKSGKKAPGNKNINLAEALSSEEGPAKGAEFKEMSQEQHLECMKYHKDEYNAIKGKTHKYIKELDETGKTESKLKYHAKMYHKHKEAA